MGKDTDEIAYMCSKDSRCFFISTLLNCCTAVNYSPLYLRPNAPPLVEDDLTGLAFDDAVAVSGLVVVVDDIVTVFFDGGGGGATAAFAGGATFAGGAAFVKTGTTAETFCGAAI